jgi:hypothetical protein
MTAGMSKAGSFKCPRDCISKFVLKILTYNPYDFVQITHFYSNELFFI